MKPPDWAMLTRSDEAAVDEGCWWDQAVVDRVRSFFARFLRHSKAPFAGKPFELLDWQYKRFVAPAFGWRRADGQRRFTEVGCAIAKKNGKSTLLAGLGLYLLVADGEAGAEVYTAAADRDQASIIYNESANMVDASPALASRLVTVRSGKRLEYPAAKSVMRALSADVPTKEGLNWSGLLFDELHAQPGPKLFNTLMYGGAARRQPLLCWITTAGVDRTSICYQKWEYCRAVRDGKVVDTRVLPVLFEAEEGADWTKESTWRAANPSLGETISLDSFRADFEKARQSASLENEFRRYRLNQWTAQVTRWIQGEKWAECAAQFDPHDQTAYPLWAGLDLASTTDVAALARLWRVSPTRFRVSPTFWVPEDTVRRRERENRFRFDHWVKAGLMRTTPGNAIDYAYIRRDIADLVRGHDLREIAIDPWNATQIATDLLGDGFEVTYVRTGFASLSAATKEFERLVLGGLIEHPGDPVLDWMVANCAVETDASGNLKPSKAASMEKIDGAVAAILALARAIATGQKRRSKYENGGIFVLGDR